MQMISGRSHFENYTNFSLFYRFSRRGDSKCLFFIIHCREVVLCKKNDKTLEENLSAVGDQMGAKENNCIGL